MSRRYWWVNQTTNYDAEIVEGRLWASANRHGTMIASRRPLLDLAPGDLVFHYNRAAVRATSTVVTGAQPTARPAAYPKRDSREPDTGWAVYVDPLTTTLRIDGTEVAARLPHGTNTLDKNGQVHRRYVSELREVDAQALASAAGFALPGPDSIAGRPWDEIVDPDDPTDGWRWAKYRREQAELRGRLLGGKDRGVCALCGNTWPAPLLIAAHIKPRRDCTEAERRDYSNVAMLLCALGCDVLFEWGYVTVDAAGTIRRGRRTGHKALRAKITSLVGQRCHRHGPASATYFQARAAAVRAIP